MDRKTSQLLLALCASDSKLSIASVKKSEIEKQLQTLSTQLALQRKKLADFEAAVKDGKLKQVLEEHRLRDEEHKIVERRKQLASLGGAKSAKFMEREIDIASKSIEAMEQQTLKSIEEADRLQEKMTELRSGVEQLEVQFETETKGREDELATLSNEIAEYTGERDSYLADLDSRVRNLYSRVRTRFPNSAVAIAGNGACQSCFRALPPQLYNQLRTGGSLIQCPGCSRILIHSPEES